ncbi:MAG: hypothetical protein KDA85_13720, partial [Planctomycetaceae bacterium]|nr:hypothetical protein [Planctomycetaceae bacterium]
MTASIPFDEISVLIPGYSIEDLPTDLGESAANSLLNALAVAWHPRLLRLSRGIPCARQAETAGDLPGRRVLLVPSCAEDWMPHEWQQALAARGNLVLSGCSTRSEWLTSLEAAISAELTEADHQAVSESEGAAQPPLKSASAPSTPDNAPSATSAQQNFSHQPPLLVDDFLAFGTTYFQIMLLSRRM